MDSVRLGKGLGSILGLRLGLWKALDLGSELGLGLGSVLRLGLHVCLFSNVPCSKFAIVARSESSPKFEFSYSGP